MITNLGPRILFTALEFSTLPNITPGMLPTNSYLPDSYPPPSHPLDSYLEFARLCIVIRFLPVILMTVV